MTKLVRGCGMVLWMAGIASAQPALHFKTRTIQTNSAAPVADIRTGRASGRGHLLLQFETRPSPQTIAELNSRGVSVLQDVPENGLLVFVDRRIPARGLGIRFVSAIDPADKISPLARPGTFLMVEFHPDVDINNGRAIVLNLGIELRENPDLNPHHLLIYPASAAQMNQLAHRDEVAYIFPASDALVNGIPTEPCLGAVTMNGATAQSIPTYGRWGTTEGSVSIDYVFSHLTSKLDNNAQQGEILRAMAEWANVVQITWQQGTNATAAQTVSILFATGEHGDGYPFDGPGGVLAHTFYPAPPNPEPIAGDMHFDDSEPWHIGANTDLFSVALHELGHALGLGHSDDPSAVMYPYYSMHTALSPFDISAMQTLYPARNSTPPPPSTPPPSTQRPGAPLALSIAAPAATTTADTLNLSGTTSGGKGATAVSWTGGLGSGIAQGSASWTISGIPLGTGLNSITVMATDGTSRVSQTVAVTRQPAASPNSPSDKTPPTLVIASPSVTSVSTSSASIVVKGTASDNVGVTSITWMTNTGSSGIASGTSEWTATIPVLVGLNAVTIQAHDAAGNVAWRSVVVTRQ